MKLLTLLFGILSISIAFSQEEDNSFPRLTKTAIGESGCYAYLPPESTEFSLEYSPDSAEVYSGDFNFGDFNYAVLVVKLNGMTLDTKEDKEAMLEQYLDFLQGSFSIAGAAGYGKGHELEKYPTAVGMIDYWVDEDEDQWVVKGWANENTLGIMIIYGPREFPFYNVQSMYLDGFRFDNN